MINDAKKLQRKLDKILGLTGQIRSILNKKGTSITSNLDDMSGIVGCIMGIDNIIEELLK